MKKGVGEPVTYRLLLHLGRFGLEIAGFCEIIIETYLPWHHLQPLANTDFLKQLDVVKSGEM